MTSEARFLINTFVVGLGFVLPVATCVFAWFKGGGAERYAAALFWLSGLGTVSFQMITHQATPVIAEMLLDTGVAIGFLGLAIRYNNLWLGAAMMVKGLQLAVHATHLTDGEDPIFLGFNLYAASLNLISLLICLILSGATFASIGRRAKDRARELARAADPPAPLVLRRASPRERPAHG